MFKSFVIMSIFATGVSLPPAADIQPVKGASLNISQVSLSWDENGFEMKPSEQVDFSLTINLTAEHAISLQF